MATTTPNFGWAVPTSTDLVKDGAVAIETLGDSIDASLVDLKGGTTNQVLAKNSNTDMDFKWVSDATGMTNPMTTTGDTIYSSSGSTPARLGIGSTGQVLTVSGGVPTWATPAGGGGKVLQVVVSANATTFQAIKTASATDVTGMSVSITPSSATSKILIMGMLNGINNQSTGTNAEVVELDLVDGSNVKIFRTNAGQCLPFAYPQMNVPFTYLHSPATTSALTYKLRVTNNTSTYGIYVNNGNSDLTSSMVAMEIGA